MERSSPDMSTRWMAARRARKAHRRSSSSAMMPKRASTPALSFVLLACAAFAGTADAQQGVPAGDVLKVCADPNNLPQSDRAGAGYENKLAEALAKDLGRKVEYTLFPQRQGFVRSTL